MPHVRTSIRSAFASQLAGLPTSGARVYTSRVHPIGRGGVPALLVRTEDERIERMTVHGPAPLLRRMLVAVDCLVETADAAEDTLDQMASEVEQALQSDPTAATLGGLLAEPMRLEQIDLKLDGESGSQIGRLSLAYVVTYRTREGVPETKL